MRVLPISTDDVQGIYALLTGLESTVAAIAAGISLAPDKIGALRQAVADMDHALDENDLDA